MSPAGTGDGSVSQPEDAAAAVSRRRGRRRQDRDRQGAAKALDRPLIRLQCYEGLDVSSAVYEWNYPAQMLEIRLAEATGEDDRSAIERSYLLGKHLIRRPVLQALEGAGRPCPGVS
jgi:hypothetical protein